MYTDLLLANKILKIISLKKPKVMLLAFCFIACMLKAQVNYIPNPSFENLVGYDNTLFYNYISVAVPWDSLRAGGGGGAVVPSPTANFGGTVCYQTAKTGSFMAALNYYAQDFTKGRSYIQSPLIYPLKSNKAYCITGYFNLLNRDKYSIDELSFYFDDGSIASVAPAEIAPANPQIKSPAGIYFTDTLNWMKVQSTFTATGTERYITIGNHKAQANLTYSLSYPSAPGIVAEYYVDDVSVIEADLPAYAGRDTVLCTGDSIFIGRPPEIGLECLWFSNGSQIAIGGGLWVKPATTKTYVVQQDVCGLIKTATVQVQVKPKYTGVPTLSTNITTACLSDTVKLNILNPPTGTKINYEWLPKSLLTSTTNTTAKTFIKQTTLFTHNTTSKGEDGFCPFVRTNTIEVVLPDSCFKYPSIPNIFTPNNDDVNDEWKIKFPYGFKLNELNIYSRWGTLLHARNNLSATIEGFASITWDGRTNSGEECSAGVYFYILSYTDKNGGVKMTKGNISLVK